MSEILLEPDFDLAVWTLGCWAGLWAGHNHRDEVGISSFDSFYKNTTAWGVGGLAGVGLGLGLGWAGLIEAFKEPL